MGSELLSDSTGGTQTILMMIKVNHMAVTMVMLQA